MEVCALPIINLRRRQDARKLSEERLPGLVESIREIGIINPLRVRPVPDSEGWEVTAGSHRLEAACRLGLADVPCVIVNDDDLRAELASIDENLCRAELSPAEAAYQTARRKEIYEALHEETRHGVAGAIGRWDAVANLATASFVADAAAQTGRAERSIRRDATRGKALGETLKDIAGTSLDKGSELDALAKLPAEERDDIVARAKSGEKVSARAPAPAPTPSDAHENDVEAEPPVKRSGLSNLTREGLEDEVSGLREENAELRRKIAALEIERDDLKMKLNDATAENLGASVGKLQRQLSQAVFARDQAFKTAKREERKRIHAEKRVSELESIGIALD